MFSIATFYQFFNIDNPISLQRRFLKFFDATKIKGTVLIAHEGINGTIAGTSEEIKQYKNFLIEVTKSESFSFQISFHNSIPFEKLKVKIKEEIVALKYEVKSSPGEYIKPENWADFISEKDVILIDNRNDYEYILGTFKNAINPYNKSFKEFPEWVREKFKNIDKSKAKIGMFCTGGIRCEKSTAMMKDMGFANVYHLEGGILNYFAKTQNKNKAWIGNCFVFDDRIAVDENQNTISITA